MILMINVTLLAPPEQLMVFNLSTHSMLSLLLRRSACAPAVRARAFGALVVKESREELPGQGSGCPHTELLGRKVLIYKRPKNAMTSGTSACEGWMLEFEHQGHWYNPLMGYTSTADPVGTVRMTFETQAAAVAFAERQGLSFSIEPAHVRRKFIKSFEGNFKFKCVSCDQYACVTASTQCIGLKVTLRLFLTCISSSLLCPSMSSAPCDHTTSGACPKSQKTTSERMQTLIIYSAIVENGAFLLDRPPGVGIVTRAHNRFDFVALRVTGGRRVNEALPRAQHLVRVFVLHVSLLAQL
jgi:NADH dehydrogenase (ubiquinone) Fe-S protein 4